MPGTIETLRVEGGPGYPAEVDLDGATSLKVRWVAPFLVNMSERSTDLLKYFGGPETFMFNTNKVEWVEDDPWNRRPTHTGLAATTTTVLVVTAQAHRYPVGTILYNRVANEYVRVIGHVDANTLSITRNIGGGSAAVWASTDEVFVSGFAMHENDNWVFRPTATFTMPFNYGQVQSVGVQQTFARMETAIYGENGNNLDKLAADTVADQFVAIEGASAHGTRSSGTSTNPAMFGGVKFYVTAANGAQVTDLSGAPLTRKDIDDILQALSYAVGGDKMAKTLVVSYWAARKISSFFAAAERLGPGMGQTAGVVVERLNTVFGVIDILVHTAVAQNEILFIRKENHKVGHHGALGRPQLRQLPPSQTGPRVQQAFYAHLSMINSGPRAEGRLHNFSITA